jgi:23S rRNA (adenine2030-N6)-methyltransferase
VSNRSESAANTYSRSPKWRFFTLVTIPVTGLWGWRGTAGGPVDPAPKERRGLVLIDPPYEEAADFARLTGVLEAAHRKWPTGIYMLWYPIKERGAPDALARRLRRLGVPKVLRCEITLRPPRADAGLVGSGVIVVNPPHTLAPDLETLFPVLIRVLAPTGAYRLDWLAREAFAAR